MAIGGSADGPVAAAAISDGNLSGRMVCTLGSFTPEIEMSVEIDDIFGTVTGSITINPDSSDTVLDPADIMEYFGYF